MLSTTTKAMVEGSAEFLAAKRLVDDLPAKLKAEGSETRWSFSFLHADKPLVNLSNQPLDDQEDAHHCWLMSNSAAYREAMKAIDAVRQKFPAWYFAVIPSGKPAIQRQRHFTEW